VPLTVAACRSLCDWTRTPAVQDGQPLFACRGCGSQWLRGERWTPCQADGSVPREVLAELKRPADAAGSANS
jgi:hypothetical protein